MSDHGHELVDMVRQLRVAIGRHARGGAWAASDRASPAANFRVDTGRDATPVLASFDAAHAIAAVRAELGDCQRCGLCAHRTNLVFGSGAASTALVFVGGAPSVDDDRLDAPFVGKAGELLDKMIVAMGWQRDQVYVGNVIGCRPLDDRAPLPTEISTCQPFLMAQLGVVAPRVIVALGHVAAHALLADEGPVDVQRGRFYDRVVAGHAVRIMPTFHPIELLQTPERKREAWADLQLVMAELTMLGVRPGPR